MPQTCIEISAIWVLLLLTTTSSRPTTKALHLILNGTDSSLTGTNFPLEINRFDNEILSLLSKLTDISFASFALGLGPSKEIFPHSLLLTKCNGGQLHGLIAINELHLRLISLLCHPLKLILGTVQSNPELSSCEWCCDRWRSIRIGTICAGIRDSAQTFLQLLYQSIGRTDFVVALIQPSLSLVLLRANVLQSLSTTGNIENNIFEDGDCPTFVVDNLIIRSVILHLLLLLHQSKLERIFEMFDVVVQSIQLQICSRLFCIGCCHSFSLPLDGPSSACI